MIVRPTCYQTADKGSLKKMDFNVPDEVHEDSDNGVTTTNNGKQVDNVCFVTKQMQQTPRKFCTETTCKYMMSYVYGKV